MSGLGIGREDFCPCGSGRKLKHCCLQQVSAGAFARASRHRQRRRPLPPGSGQRTFATGTPREPSLHSNLKVKVFLRERREWKNVLYRDVVPGQEFIVGNRLYRLHSAEGASLFPEIDVAKIPEADRSFDPANWRRPRANDVVYVLDELPDPSAPFHRQLCEVEPGQHFLFQGRTCTIKPHEAGSGYRVVLLEADTPKDEALYVWVEYQMEDLLGKADVAYRYPLGQRILLAHGAVLPVEALTPGMIFVLERGGVATVTRVAQPERWQPDQVFRDPSGNSLRRVVGTFRFTGWVQLMTVTVGGEVHEVTPGHPYWSETRQGWYPISSFVVGELLLTIDKLPIPIEALTSPRWIHETVYNVEVDEYHTYFVGRGKTAVWSHNGMSGGGCGVPKAAEAGEPAVPKRFPNLLNDAVYEVPAFRLDKRNGKWVTISTSGNVRTARGANIFVVAQDGTVFVTRRSPPGAHQVASHADLARGRPVLYAGEIQFSGNGGVIRWWNNRSGHYQPGSEFAHQAGLSMDLFRPFGS
jgi:hypothetical protein